MRCEQRWPRPHVIGGRPHWARRSRCGRRRELRPRPLRHSPVEGGRRPALRAHRRQSLLPDGDPARACRRSRGSRTRRSSLDCCRRASVRSSCAVSTGCPTASLRSSLPHPCSAAISIGEWRKPSSVPTPRLVSTPSTSRSSTASSRRVAAQRACSSATTWSARASTSTRRRIARARLHSRALAELDAHYVTACRARERVCLPRLARPFGHRCRDRDRRAARRSDRGDRLARLRTGGPAARAHGRARRRSR